MASFSVHGLTAILNQLLPEPHAGLLAALLFGAKTGLPRDLYDAFVRSGTIHIAALSGQNLSIVSRLVSDQLMPVIGKRNASLLTLFLIWWFVWFVGPSSTIVRAAIMGSLSVTAVLLGRQYWSVFSWVLAVGSMLLLNFRWVFELSFQLSALATLGIILFGKDTITGSRALCSEHSKMRSVGNPLSVPPVRDGLFRMFWMAIRDDLRITLAAQSLTVPLIFLHFHRISLIAPVANISVGWLIGPLTELGWITLIAGWVGQPLGVPFALVDWVGLEYLVRTVRMFGGLPFASVGY